MAAAPRWCATMSRGRSCCKRPGAASIPGSLASVGSSAPTARWRMQPPTSTASGSRRSGTRIGWSSRTPTATKSGCSRTPSRRRGWSRTRVRPGAASSGHPRKLGHVNFLTGAIRPQKDFYIDALGMRLTDWLGDGGVWLHVNTDHHVMALVDKGYAHFHHLAFDVVDIGQMRVALDHLGRHGRWLGWGPARHGVGGNIASYVRIVEEACFVELYCDMEQLQADPPAARLDGSTATRRTPGGRCRRARISGSTMPRSRRNATASRCWESSRMSRSTHDR